jgi:hypothetical protein
MVGSVRCSVLIIVTSLQRRVDWYLDQWYPITLSNTVVMWAFDMVATTFLSFIFPSSRQYGGLASSSTGPVSPLFCSPRLVARVIDRMIQITSFFFANGRCPHRSVLRVIPGRYHHLAFVAADSVGRGSDAALRCLSLAYPTIPLLRAGSSPWRGWSSGASPWLLRLLVNH